jgi:hypothetical protein
MKTSRIILFLSLSAANIAAISGCDTTGPGKSSSHAFIQTKPVSVAGTVVFRDKDGGFYGILADNGGQYEPANLDARFQNDGMRITLAGKLDTSRVGMHHWGNPIDLATVIAAK